MCRIKRNYIYADQLDLFGSNVKRHFKLRDRWYNKLKKCWTELHVCIYPFYNYYTGYYHHLLWLMFGTLINHHLQHTTLYLFVFYQKKKKRIPSFVYTIFNLFCHTAYVNTSLMIALKCIIGVWIIKMNLNIFVYW